MGFCDLTAKKGLSTPVTQKTAIYLKIIGTLEQTFKIKHLSPPKLEQKLEQLDMLCSFGVLGKVKFYI